jgi:hypothetical protein
MKGSPLLRAFVLLATLLLLAWPLRRVTLDTSPEGPGVQANKEPQPAEAPAASPQKLGLMLSFTRGAERIELRHLGALVWEKDRPALRELVDLNLPFPREGIELAVTVRWPGTDLSALRLQLTTPDGTELDRSAWGSETVEAVISFP